MIIEEFYLLEIIRNILLKKNILLFRRRKDLKRDQRESERDGRGPQKGVTRRKGMDDDDDFFCSDDEKTERDQGEGERDGRGRQKGVASSNSKISPCLQGERDGWIMMMIRKYSCFFIVSVCVFFLFIRISSLLIFYIIKWKPNVNFSFNFQNYRIIYEYFLIYHYYYQKNPDFFMVKKGYFQE